MCDKRVYSKYQTVSEDKISQNLLCSSEKWSIDWHMPVEPGRRCTAGTCFSLIDSTRATNFINLIHLFISHSLTSVATGVVAGLVNMTHSSPVYCRPTLHFGITGRLRPSTPVMQMTLLRDRSASPQWNFQIYIRYEYTRYNWFFFFFSEKTRLWNRVRHSKVRLPNLY
jgi:hypothetical protein